MQTTEAAVRADFVSCRGGILRALYSALEFFQSQSRDRGGGPAQGVTRCLQRDGGRSYRSSAPRRHRSYWRTYSRRAKIPRWVTSTSDDAIVRVTSSIFTPRIEEPSGRGTTRYSPAPLTGILRLQRSTNVLRCAPDRTSLTASARTPRGRRPAGHLARRRCSAWRANPGCAGRPRPSRTEPRCTARRRPRRRPGCP